jgi:translocation and assembly module TamA
MRAAARANRLKCHAWLVALLAAGPTPAAGQPAPNPLAPDQPAADPILTTDFADIGLEWPSLDSSEVRTERPGPPTEGPNAAAAVPDQSGLARPDDMEGTENRRYSITITGLELAADDRLLERFDAFSELRKGAGKPANLAQINRRARSDTAMLDQLLRARGYYDARSRFALVADADRPGQITIAIEATSGRRYALRGVEIRGLNTDDARDRALRALLAIEPGDPADSDAILTATDRLRTGLARGGYPFAKVEEPVLTVDHDTRDATVDLAVVTGGYQRFGQIRMEGGERPFGAAHMADIARFQPGDPFDAEQLADLNRALVSTGLVSTVSLMPQPGKDNGIVDIVAALSPAPPRTIAGELGYGTGEGARAELSWQHRNLFPPEGALTLRGVAGTNEQSAAVIFRRSNAGERDRAFNLELSAANINQQAYQAQTLGLSGNLERQTNILFQKTWAWSLGAELRLSDERDLYGNELTPRRRTFVIAALPTALTYDGSNDLLNPTRGYRLGGRLSPELSLQAGAFGYVRAQIDGSAYLPMRGEKLVLAGRVRLGTIIGAGRDRIAPTRRFYAGGGGSVRGYSYQAIGPRDLNNDPLGGRSLTELSIEARVRFGRQQQFGLVPFIDAGTISTAALPALRDLRVGAGLGLRYYSNFGPIRIDVGTPLNPQPGDSRVAVTVSLGQAF